MVFDEMLQQQLNLAELVVVAVLFVSSSLQQFSSHLMENYYARSPRNSRELVQLEYLKIIKLNIEFKR